MRKSLLVVLMALSAPAMAYTSSVGHTIYQCGAYRLEETSILDKKDDSGMSDVNKLYLKFNNVLMKEGDLSDFPHEYDNGARILSIGGLVIVTHSKNMTASYTADGGQSVHPCLLVMNKWKKL